MFAQVIATKTIRMIPGRLRITVNGLRRNPVFAQYLVQFMQRIDGIQCVSANPLTGRVLIYYDAGRLTLPDLQGQLSKARSTFGQVVAECSQPAVAAAVSPELPAHPAAISRPRPSVDLLPTPPKIQLINTVLTGSILAGLVVKRLLMGRSMLSSSQRVFNLAAITTIVAGYPILRRGIAHLVENKKVNHDLLISAASLVLLAMRESITGLSVLWLVQISSLFSYIMQIRSRRAIRNMLLGKQYKARRLKAGGYETVDIDELAVGDVVVIRAGERVSVDGAVVDGKAVVNQAAICGEYLPGDKQSGDSILAGTLVEAGWLNVKAEKVGQDTSVAKIVAMVEQAAAGRSAVEQSGEIYSGRLMPWAIGIAGAVFLLTRDFQRSLAVLLAGCPAAVALSSHTALGMAVTQAARQGIFVKDARYLATAEQVDTVLFDKTGTLTSSQPEIAEIVVLDRDRTEEGVLALAAAVETTASHPLARMLSEAAKARGLSLQSADSQLIIGYGVKGTVAKDSVIVGSERFMQQQQVDTEVGKARALRLRHLGSSVLYVAVNGRLAGLIGICDTLREESRQAVEELRAAGIDHIGVLTGDTTDSANAISDQLGLSKSWGAMLPENKLKVVAGLRQTGRRVAMVGDGINDSPAMAAADVGIAMGAGGSDLAIRAADVVLCGDDPRKIAATVELSRQAMQIMRQNLAFSAGASVVGIALAAARFISPVTAALLLNVSTLGVIFNSARLLSGNANCRVRGAEHGRLTGQSLNLQQFAEPPAVTKAAPAKVLQMPTKSEQPAGELQAQGRVWHALPVEQVCDKLATSASFGLSEQIALERRKRYGLNVLAQGEKASFWKLFVHQFKDFMVQVLLGAAGVSYFLGDVKDAILTLAIVMANAFLGAFQESKAEQSLDCLQKMAAPVAKVIRGGRMHQIKAEYLAPGDLIVLEAGDRVPADARLVKASQFEVEEASLTGETVPVKKNYKLVGTDQMPLGDRKNMVFMGTSVTRGRAYAVVVGTGMGTEMGKIAAMLHNHQFEPTPLQIRLEELGKIVVYGCLAVSGLVMVTGLLRGQTLLHMVQTAASLAVAAIPEGLSAIVVIALAMGVQRMATQNIIVRKMSSIETLGCAKVICSDKTGTLTKNEMTVRKIYTGCKMWQLSGEGYTPHGKFYHKDIAVDPAADAQLTQTLLAGALCNNAKLIDGRRARNEQVVNLSEARQKGWTIHGDPTEGALLVAAAKADIWENKLTHSYPRVKEIPFEPERRMMSVVCTGHDNVNTLYCKGAADAVLTACTHYLTDGQVTPLTPELRDQFYQVSEQMANEALRVLATAYRMVPTDEDIDSDNLERDLIFSGLVGMIDPPRPEVPQAIAKCKQAGVKVVMITGDHPNTARAISRELGLLDKGGMVLIGQQLDRMSDDELAAVVENVSVYARTAPQHKLRIIKAFKQKGYVVAMTGDGINDAPAIKAADIGIAMGIMGTDVTKEAASMTLADDNFATIVRAMEEGRSIYANIRKAIRYALATNMGEVVLMFLAALIGLPLPLIPIQLLWINLIGDGLPVIALVNDPPAKKIMKQPPRSADDSVFSGGLGRKILTRGAMIGLSGVALYAWKLMASGNVIAARTLIVAQVAISQFIHIFDCRVEKDNAGKVGLFSNWALVGAVGLSMAMIVGIIHIPALQAIFGTTALGLGDWLTALLVAAGTAALDMGVGSTLDKLFPSSTEPIVKCVPEPMPVV